MTADRQGPGISWRAIALYVAGSLLCYHGVLPAGLLSDDFLALDAFRRGLPVWSWGQDQGGFFRPVTTGSLWLGILIHGGSPAWMHVGNVLLHACCACIVHALWPRLSPGRIPQNGWPAAIAGALFLVHPSHAEVVAWIACRGDLLATAFGLLGVLFGLDYARGGSSWRLAVVGAAWSLAVFSKESALAAPGIFLALAAVVCRHHSWRRIGAVVGTGAAVVAAAALARLAVFGELIAGTGEQSRLVMSSGKLLGALKRQVLRTFLPAMAGGDTPTLVGSIAVGGLLLFAVLLVVRQALADPRRRPHLAQLLGLALAYASALVPAIGAKVHIDGGEGERFVYLATALAMLGVAQALAWGAGRRRGLSIGIAWILVYALLAQRAAGRWAIAGMHAERIVDAIVAESRGSRPLILALPDSVEGALVFRNGLKEAVAWQRRDLEITLLATFMADRSGGGAKARRSSVRPGAWEIDLGGARPHRQLRAPSLVLSMQGGSTLRIETVDLSSFSDLFLFRDAELVRLDSEDP